MKTQIGPSCDCYCRDQSVWEQLTTEKSGTIGLKGGTEKIADNQASGRQSEQPGMAEDRGGQAKTENSNSGLRLFVALVVVLAAEGFLKGGDAFSQRLS
jgi:hypothetical protein